MRRMTGKQAGTVVEALMCLLVAGLLFFPPPRLYIRAWHIVRTVPVTAPVVALTFDDGPHPVYTSQILDALAAAGAKATFFMIGRRMEEYPGLVQRVVVEGHAIGNHTYSHPRSLSALPAGAVRNELARAAAVQVRLTGVHGALFRPPRGRADATVLRQAEAMGYVTVTWTVCADNANAPTPEAMADRVLRAVRPGVIVLIHDGQSRIRWKDVAATRLILQGLQARGYRCVTVPELLAMAR